MNYRPYGCMRCGGKMKKQKGGRLDPVTGQWIEDGQTYAMDQYQPEAPAPDAPTQDRQKTTFIQPRESQVPTNVVGMQPQAIADNQMQSQMDMLAGKDHKQNQSGTGKEMNHSMFGLQFMNNALSYLSNRMEMKRQNNYMYKQYSTLGQLQPMPANDYQPNPYNLYMRMGGNLKHYQTGGPTKGFRVDLNQLPAPVKPTPRYNFPYLNGLKPAATDTSNYNEVFNDYLSHGQDYINTNYIAPAQGNFMSAFGKDNQKRWMDILATYNNANVDAEEQLNNPDSRPRPTGAKYFSQKTKHKYGGLANANMYDQGFTNEAEMDFGPHRAYKKGGWIQNAVNPEHKGFCTPLSNPKCTGHRRAFAMMMKKNHGFHKD